MSVGGIQFAITQNSLIKPTENQWSLITPSEDTTGALWKRVHVMYMSGREYNSETLCYRYALNMYQKYYMNYYEKL